MKRWILGVLLLLAAPAAAQVLDPTGAWGVWVPDRSTSATLGALNNAATLQLAGRAGAGFQLTTANLNATVTPEVSFDNGTTWLATSFVTVGGTTSSTVVFGGGADTQQRSIVVVGGVSHVRVRVSSYTSGTSTAVVRNTAVPSILLQVGNVGVTQVTSPWVVSGTVNAAQSGTWTVQPGNTANTTAWLVTGTGGTFPVTDSAGSLTVDAPAGTPVAVRPSDGSAFVTPENLDLDSGAGTVNREAVGIAGAASGGPVPIEGTAANGLEVDVTRVQGTVTVSGTVTTTPPSNASTNVAQFGGTNVSTGTGAGGAGIPRVTISNDSSLAANQSVNLSQVGGTNTVTGGTAGSLGVGGTVAHDAVGTSVNPLLEGGYASAAAPSDVSNDGDAVRGWNLRNGARAIQETYAGVLSSAGAGTTGTGTKRVIQASDSTLTVSTSTDAGSCVTITGSSTTILSSNASRRGYRIFAPTTNTATVFVSYSGTATTSSFPFPVGSADNAQAGALVYTGAITGIRSGLVADQSMCRVEW